MEASEKFLLLSFHRGFRFVSYYSVEERRRVTVLLVSFTAAGSDQEFQIAAAPLPVCSPYGLVSWVPPITLGEKGIQPICLGPIPHHTCSRATPCLCFSFAWHWTKITGNGAAQTLLWAWQQPTVSLSLHSLEDNLHELLPDLPALTIHTWSWSINSDFSNFTFFFANEYFFFVLTSSSALRLLLGLIILVSFKSKSENLKRQASRSSPWSAEVEEGIWFGCSSGADSFQLTIS